MDLATAFRSTLVFRDCLIGVLFLFIAKFLPKLKPERKDLHGKTAIVTGSNSGVGYGIAFQLAEMGAHVVLACRSEKRASTARKSMVETCPSAQVSIMQLDTSSFESVRAFAKQWRNNPIDILVHNAGIPIQPEGQQFTEDGFEYVYQANFLSSFLLTRLLECNLHPKARVIFTSSVGSYVGQITDDFPLERTTRANQRGFHTLLWTSEGQYPQTKLMQAAFARSLQERFDKNPDNKRMAFSFEPGLIKTNILSASSTGSMDWPSWTLAVLMPITGLEIDQGAATGVHLAVADIEKLGNSKGRYFDRMQPRTHLVDLYTQEKLDRLWIRWCADCDIDWK